MGSPLSSQQYRTLQAELQARSSDTSERRGRRPASALRPGPLDERIEHGHDPAPGGQPDGQRRHLRGLVARLEQELRLAARARPPPDRTPATNRPAGRPATTGGRRRRRRPGPPGGGTRATGSGRCRRGRGAGRGRCSAGRRERPSGLRCATAARRTGSPRRRSPRTGRDPSSSWDRVLRTAGRPSTRPRRRPSAHGSRNGPSRASRNAFMPWVRRISVSSAVPSSSGVKPSSDAASNRLACTPARSPAVS